jgi:AcrR family transcriptional regulator
VHYCFDDKDAMLRAMGRAIAMRASEQVLAALDAGPERGDLAEAAIDAMLGGLKQHQHMRLLTFEFAVSGARTPVLREVAQAHLKQSIAMTREYLQRLADVAGVTYRTEIGLLARMTALRIDGIELAWMVDQDDEAARAGFADLAQAVFDQMQPA